MTKIRLALAGAVLTAAVAPTTATPAQAAACQPAFEIVCTAIRTACYVVEQIPQAECITLH